MILIVTSPFAGHARGDSITDAEQVSSILSGQHRSSVVRLAEPVAPTASQPTVAEAVAEGVAAAEKAPHPAA